MALTAVGFRFLLAFVFLSASIPKLAASAEFRTAVANYRLLPDGLVRPVARWLPRAELAAACALLFGLAVPAVGLVVCLLLLAFAAAVALNLAHGRTIECGCFGASVPVRITWNLVARDVTLAAVAVVVAVAAPRALAVPIPWPRLVAGSASSSDALALAGAAALLVLLEALLVEVRRANRAAREALRASEREAAL